MADAVTVDELDAALGGLPRRRTQGLPALHAAHGLIGWLPAWAVERAARWVHVPKSEMWAIATSYTEFRFAEPAEGTVRVCRGLSCRIAGGRERSAELLGRGVPVEEHECMFACAAAPIEAAGHGPVEAALGGAAFAMARNAIPGGLQRVTAMPSADAASWPAWTAIRADADRWTPAAVIDLVEEAGLRGRGGAYFPAAIKWRGAVDAAPANGEPILVVNAEEGEPGVFKDRFLMERDPNRLLEGIRIAAYAIGASTAYCYVNGQADRSAAAMAAALEEARAAGLLEEPPLEIEVRRGAGGYVCGEETVILESIEGRRAVPRLRPPLPVQAGLWGRPTVINNVETLANLPDIASRGAGWFREAGTDDAPGTKVLSLSGAFELQGVLEAPLGTTAAEVIEIAGPAEPLAGVAIGGPSGGFLAPSAFDAPLLPGALDGHGAVLGAGGIVAIPERFGIGEALDVQAAYNAAESCGKCTPCREGSERMRDALRRLRSGDPRARADLDVLIPVIAQASLCGLGQMAPNPLTSARHQFGDSVA